MANAIPIPWPPSRGARWALGLGLASLAALLGFAQLRLAFSRHVPSLAWRVQDLDLEPAVVKSSSLHLQKGRVIVLDEGASERWRCLMRLKGGQPSLEKKLRRLRRGRPMRLMLGRSLQPDPIWLPQASLVLRIEPMQATGYDSGPVSPKRGYVGLTSIGERARFGIIAVDPRVVPYRSRLYIEGYGPGLAADTGGGIKGHRLDLCFDSTRQARDWGRRKVQAYVLAWMPKAKAKKALLAAGLAKP